MTTIALGMEVETPRGEIGQVVASPRDGRGWLVQLYRYSPVKGWHGAKEIRLHEESLREHDASWD
jgi:hypothetical protein